MSETTTKERPILFSAPMVNAILDGRKTQMRLVVKPQPSEGMIIHGPELYEPMVIRRGEEVPGAPVFGIYDSEGDWGVECPYGQPGDRLWVRHSFWCCEVEGQGVGNLFAVYDDEIVKGIPQPKTLRPWQFATGKFPRAGRIRSIHMPRWASRIDLEITGARKERVQEISEADAIAEGIEIQKPESWQSDDGMIAVHRVGTSYRDYSENYNEWWDNLHRSFETLWDSINAKPKPVYERDQDGKRVINHYTSYPWDCVYGEQIFHRRPHYVYGNPLVWVMEFGQIN